MRASWLKLSLVVALAGHGVVLAASPEANMLFNQGLDAYNQGRMPYAQSLFEQTVRMAPDHTNAFFNLGSIYYKNNRYAEARDAFLRVLSLNPNDYQARYNLALAQEQLKEYSAAYDNFSVIPATDRKYNDARRKMESLKAHLSPPQQKPTPVVQTPSTPVTDPNAKVAVKTFSKGYSGPTGMSIGPGGYMYVANYSKNTIYKVGANGEKVVFVEGDGLHGPIGVTHNPKTGELYVANYLKNNIVRVNGDGKVSVLASGLNKPYNLYLDGVNNVLYVSEQETNVVSKIELP